MFIVMASVKVYEVVIVDPIDIHLYFFTLNLSSQSLAHLTEMSLNQLEAFENR